MATIVVQTEVNSTVEKVWEVVSNIDNEPRFWKGTKEVKTLSKEGKGERKRDKLAKLVKNKKVVGAGLAYLVGKKLIQIFLYT